MEDGDRWDVLWEHVNLATMVSGSRPYGSVYDGALAARGGRIAWVGPTSAVPTRALRTTTEIRDGKGAWMTPALVDCHTHAVFGGNRSDEFERRLRGESYGEIAHTGSGILSTVRATREGDEETLFRRAASRLRSLLSRGVTAVEVKSGYGLDLETELRMLRVGRRLGRELPVTVRTTFLGAHALPDEFERNREGYLRMVTSELIPRVVEEGLADAVDAFCEPIAFTPDECARVLRAGRERGLALRLHADQLSSGGGAELAANLGAASADHLEHVEERGVVALEGERGTLEPGKVADLVLWDVDHPRELAYWMGRNPRIPVVRRGEVVAPRTGVR